MTILFDFDGTICNSLPTFLALYNTHLAGQGKKTITKEQFRSCGLLKVAAQNKISKINLIWYVFLARRYARRHIHKMEPFAGLPNQIKRLSKSHTLGIVTSNSKDNVKKFLMLNGLVDYFNFIETKISYFNKGQKLKKTLIKYKIERDECIYVGDETRDTIAAKEAGIRAVSVTWGFESKAVLIKSKPFATISKPSNLYKRVSKIL